MSMSIEKALDKIADVLTKTTDDANGSIEYSLSVIADALENGGGGGGGDEIVCGFTRSRSEYGSYTGEFERTTDEDPYDLLDAIQAGKIVKGIIHSGAPGMRDGDILYSTAVVLSRSGSMGGFGGIEFTFVEFPQDASDAVLIKLKINENGSLTVVQKKITAEAVV